MTSRRGTFGEVKAEVAPDGNEREQRQRILLKCAVEQWDEPKAGCEDGRELEARLPQTREPNQHR